MSDTETARLLALVRGEPVGEPCTQWHPHGSYHPDVCFGGCNGTGRINTEPVGEVERAVAEARAKLDWAMRELDLATRALEAERAAHQVTRFELISISGAEDWESAMGWVIVMNTSHTAMQKAHEETKRQLAELRAAYLDVTSTHSGVHPLVVERDTALRERDHWKDDSVFHSQRATEALHEKAEAERQRDQFESDWVAAKYEFGIKYKAAEQRATEAEATVASLACMLGWANVPPRDTLERSVSALNFRMKEAEALARHLSELEAGAECMHNRAAVAAAEAARDAALARVEELRRAHGRKCDENETLREALRFVTTAQDVPMLVMVRARDALATTPTAGLMEKVRGLCAASERACVDLACQRDDVSCFEVNAQPRCEMCAVSEALTALYAIAPGVKP